jgi:hypothetical protein
MSSSPRDVTLLGDSSRVPVRPRPNPAYWFKHGTSGGFVLRFFCPLVG